MMGMLLSGMMPTSTDQGRILQMKAFQTHHV